MALDLPLSIEPDQHRLQIDRTDLDPRDWQAFATEAHALLDRLIGGLQGLRDEPVWQPPTNDALAAFERPLPLHPQPLSAVIRACEANVLPYASGNRHPRFMGWAQGAGSPAGMIAELVIGALNMNCGGRDHIGLAVETQIVRWMADAFAYPDTASGLFVTGSSTANLLAVLAAKVKALGPETRKIGLREAVGMPVGYCSSEAHGCITRAFEMSGIGRDGLRQIPVDAAGRMDVEQLMAAIEADKRRGHLPFVIVATAGTVNTGAIDPLDEIACIADREGIWLHVDGAIGALATFAPTLRPLLEGIERSNSIALDFHKWGHVPYDAGFLLVRDERTLKDTFSNPAAYLQRGERGLAKGDVWPCDLGPDLSRGFRALKTWFTISTHGAARIGDAIASNCELARALAEHVRCSDVFELKAEVHLNIVCFGLKGRGHGPLNRDIVMDVQEAGVAAPSWTTIDGEDVIRCAIFNHRTCRADIDVVMSALHRCAKRRMASLKATDSNASGSGSLHEVAV